jgi:hypothetical protein
LTGLSRPTLAVLNEDYPKVKNIESKQEINGLLNFLINIINIKVSSEEEKLQLDKQMVLIFDLIKTKFGSLTVPEIKEAFKMFVAKEFPELKVFRILDCVVVADVLNAYKDYRNETLRVYDAKKRLLLAESYPITENDKEYIRNDFLRKIFDELNLKGYSSSIWLCWEKDMKTKELTEFAKRVNATVTNAEKREIYAIEEQMYLKEIKAEMTVSRMQSAKWFVQNATDQIKKGLKINVVVNRCRCVIGSKYLKDYLTDFEEFKNQIEL